jgi:hypothetical protein
LTRDRDKMGMMPTSKPARIALLATCLAWSYFLHQPVLAAGAQRDPNRFAAVKQWKAEVIVKSDCDRTAPDGSRTIIHNHTTTTYAFDRRATNARIMTWVGRASTTYQWSVGTEFQGRRDIEEGSASYESDGRLELGESTKITIGRIPGRPFTRKKYLGDLLLESSTANDEPPAAELFEAPLPAESGAITGERTEAAYSLLGGLVLTCPAHRRWTIRAS